MTKTPWNKNKSIQQKAKELTKLYKGKYWKFYDSQTKEIFQWNGEKYVPEYNDKQL